MSPARLVRLQPERKSEYAAARGASIGNRLFLGVSSVSFSGVFALLDYRTGKKTRNLRWSEQFSFGEIADEATVSGKEVVCGQVFERHPAEVIEDTVFNFALKGIHGKKLQVDGASIAVGVTDADDGSADAGPYAKFLVKLTHKGLLRSFAGFDFSAWELPLERHRLIGTALADENGVVAQDESGGDHAHGFYFVLLNNIHVLPSLDA